MPDAPTGSTNQNPLCVKSPDNQDLSPRPQLPRRSTLPAGPSAKPHASFQAPNSHLPDDLHGGTGSSFLEALRICEDLGDASSWPAFVVKSAFFHEQFCTHTGCSSQSLSLPISLHSSSFKGKLNQPSINGTRTTDENLC